MIFFAPVLRVAAALLFVVAALPANAAPVAYTFSASISTMWEFDSANSTITHVGSSTFPGALVELDDVFTGVMAFDPAAPLHSYVPAQPPNGQYLMYQAPALVGMSSFSNAGGDITYLSNNAWFGAMMQIQNDNEYGQDYFSIDNSGAYGGDLYQLANFYFFDSTGILFNSAQLPEALRLSDFDYTGFGASWLRISDGDQFHISGAISRLDAIGAQDVPEPFTISLIALAVAAAFAARRNRSAGLQG